uniref:Uncharacterized protein n=1 Tax=Romanomermis culicivorax TaxID=13658 RepID=A0A915KJ72_ROMCU
MLGHCFVNHVDSMVFSAKMPPEFVEIFDVPDPDKAGSAILEPDPTIAVSIISQEVDEGCPSTMPVIVVAGT